MGDEHPLELLRLEQKPEGVSEFGRPQQVEEPGVASMKRPRFAQSRGLMIFEILLYLAFLAWFLKTFLPVGLR